MKKCLHQIIKSKGLKGINVEGVGDCSTCQPDENNKKCRRYFPASDFVIIEVKKNAEDDEDDVPSIS